MDFDPYRTFRSAEYTMTIVGQDRIGFDDERPDAIDCRLFDFDLHSIDATRMSRGIAVIAPSYIRAASLPYAHGTHRPRTPCCRIPASRDAPF
jgi:hypothetical protein